MTRYLTPTEALVVGRANIPGLVVRDTSLLESALARPSATAFGVEAYPDLHLKAAALLHSIVKNHPLVDGNKRLAWALTWVLFELNGHTSSYQPGDVFDFLLETAADHDVTIERIAANLHRWYSPST